MSKLTVMFEVDAAHSGDIMTALAPCMPRLCNFSMEAAKAKRVVRGRKKLTHSATLDRLDQGPATVEEIAEALAASGLSESSASPTLSVLSREGSVWRDEEGKWHKKETQ